MTTTVMTRLKERLADLLATPVDKKSNKSEDHGGLTSQAADLILEEAIGQRASDIHIEPLDGEIRVRYRIDGQLYEVLNIEDHYNLLVTTRLKIMAGLQTDAMTKRQSQDGRFTARIAAANYDFRVSTFPTVQGEKMAIRILNEDIGLYDLSKIGLDSYDESRIDQILQHKNGILLVCGPTGSGKTTTLYAVLNRINSPRKNIVTLEDPVEYRIPGMNQCDIKSKSGFSFADGLKSVLRQDPDIILVGEIRDIETANIALRAAMTGHIVFSSLHANSAIGTVIRLVNMGLEPFIVSYAMVGAIAQRLVRRICVQCKKSFPAPQEILESLKNKHNIPIEDLIARHQKALSGAGKPPQTEGPVFYKGEGCDFCQGTGYRGRVGVFEIVIFDDELRNAVLRSASTQELQQIAIREGTKPLALDGVMKVVAGDTTLDEIYTVLVEK